MIDLEAIRARDADGDNLHLNRDRRALLAYVDELREAARKVTCWVCRGERQILLYGDFALGGIESFGPCPDCADLRRLLGEST